MDRDTECEISTNCALFGVSKRWVLSLVYNKQISCERLNLEKPNPQPSNRKRCSIIHIVSKQIPARIFLNFSSLPKMTTAQWSVPEGEPSLWWEPPTAAKYVLHKDTHNTLFVLLGMKATSTVYITKSLWSKIKCKINKITTNKMENHFHECFLFLIIWFVLGSYQ